MKRKLNAIKVKPEERDPDAAVAITVATGGLCTHTEAKLEPRLQLPLLDAPHTRVPVQPGEAYPMTVQNYVSSGRLLWLDRPGARLPIQKTAGAIEGTCSTRGFPCVTLRVVRRKVCCESHAAIRFADAATVMTTAHLHAQTRGITGMMCCHIYETGCVILCGARTKTDALSGIYDIMRVLLIQYDWHLRLQDHVIKNVVTSVGLGFPLDLRRMFLTLSNLSGYDPQHHPGLHYFPEGFPNKRAKETKPCVIAYSTGVVVFVGARSLSHSLTMASAIDWRSFMPAYWKTLH